MNLVGLGLEGFAIRLSGSEKVLVGEVWKNEKLKEFEVEGE